MPISAFSPKSGHTFYYIGSQYLAKQILGYPNIFILNPKGHFLLHPIFCQTNNRDTSYDTPLIIPKKDTLRSEIILKPEQISTDYSVDPEHC